MRNAVKEVEGMMGVMPHRSIFLMYYYVVSDTFFFRFFLRTNIICFALYPVRHLHRSLHVIHYYISTYYLDKCYPTQYRYIRIVFPFHATFHKIQNKLPTFDFRLVLVQL
jgi:hypothetical protein